MFNSSINISIARWYETEFSCKMMFTTYVLHCYLDMFGTCPSIGEMCLSICWVECQSQSVPPRPKARLNFGIQLLGMFYLHDRIGKSHLVLNQTNRVDVAFSVCNLPYTAWPFLQHVAWHCQRGQPTFSELFHLEERIFRGRYCQYNIGSSISAPWVEQ
jgi:hypothetical protein